MDGCVFALMEISKQKPASSSHLHVSSIATADEWMKNNKDCVTELTFEINPDIQTRINNAKDNISRKVDNLYLELKSFNAYGKSVMKEMKIHPDTFIQIAIQVAGYKTRGL